MRRTRNCRRVQVGGSTTFCSFWLRGRISLGKHYSTCISSMAVIMAAIHLSATAGLFKSYIERVEVYNHFKVISKRYLGASDANRDSLRPSLPSSGRKRGNSLKMTDTILCYRRNRLKMLSVGRARCLCRTSLPLSSPFASSSRMSSSTTSPPYPVVRGPSPASPQRYKREAPIDRDLPKLKASLLSSIDSDQLSLIIPRISLISFV